MQYLVHCSDLSYCLLYEKEIVYDPENPDPDIGVNIKFNWGSNEKVIFSGTVVKKSGREYLYYEWRNPWGFYITQTFLEIEADLFEEMDRRIKHDNKKSNKKLEESSKKKKDDKKTKQDKKKSEKDGDTTRKRSLDGEENIQVLINLWNFY